MMIRKSIRGPFKVKGSDFWYVEIRGKRRSLKTEDEAIAKRIIAEIKAKDEIERSVAPKKGMMLCKFIEKYLSWSEGVHAEGTVDANRNALEKLQKYVGETKDIAEITAEDADTLLSNMRKKGNSPAYCNIILRHCRSALNKAVEWRIIERNAMVHTKLLATEKKPPAWLQSVQIGPFLKTINDQDFKLLIAAYLITGRRRVELLRLTWKDVDFENRRYYIRGKAHLSRWFPMNQSFKAILEFMPRSEEGRIWPRWADRTVTHFAKRYLRAAGYGNLRLHDLRHSFAVNYLSAGGEMGVLKELLGHRQISTTLIYGKVTDKLSGSEIERVGIDMDSLS